MVDESKAGVAASGVAPILFLGRPIFFLGGDSGGGDDNGESESNASASFDASGPASGSSLSDESSRSELLSARLMCFEIVDLRCLCGREFSLVLTASSCSDTPEDARNLGIVNLIIDYLNVRDL